MRMTRSRSTAAAISSLWDGWLILCASECTATERISTSIAISIPPMFVLPLAVFAPSAEKRIRREPTPWLLKKLSIRETLQELKTAGVDSLPGGGAEIFADRVRHIICDHKIDGDQWLETARLAHNMGLRSNATMLYGHVENDEDRVDHLMKLRALQDRTGGFQTFIPLAFHPDNPPLQPLQKNTGMLDIKQIAVSRLVLDNFPHIKAYWQMLTPKIAQIALRFGADDLD